MKNSIKLYFEYIAILLKTSMQYKISFFFSVIGQCLITFNAVVGIYFLFLRFNNLKGFLFSEVMLCFSIVLMSFSIAESYARGFDSFASLIITGEFDRMLVRPRSLILQVLGSKFEFTRVGNLIVAIPMFIYGIVMSNLNWTFLKILTVIFMLTGGIVIFSGLFLIYATISFFTIQGLEVMNIFTDGARTFGAYPISIYGKNILRFCTFIIPYSLFQYYPLQYLFDKTYNPLFIIAPLISTLFLIPCYALWRFGVYSYKSTGS